MYFEIVLAEGHLIDSDILTNVFDTVIACGSSYEVVEFRIGRTNEQVSHIKLKVLAKSQERLDQTVSDLMALGCYRLNDSEATVRPAVKQGCVPDDFYSTTNHRTQVLYNGQWLSVENQRMDAVIRISGARAECIKLRDVQQGDQIVCGNSGIRVQPEFKERDRYSFAFMANDISSERRVETQVKKIAEFMREVRAKGGKIVFVAGPVVVHTGGVEAMCSLIRKGYVQALLSGNALAVHDIENALYGTSLGVDLEKGLPIFEGHKNHMRAINTVCREGGMAACVDRGILRSGIMYEILQSGMPFVLAGSIRDDGPLPETVMDLVTAQNEYARVLKEASLVICLSSMLHSIAVGNMLPSFVRTVCVDINPAVVTKLSDRGSSQAVGVVTDVGLFLNLLSSYLENGR